MIIGGIVSLSILVVIFIMVIKNYREEVVAYNNGICPKCGKKLKKTDTNTIHNRRYDCDCGYYTWVSHSSIDKNNNK